MIGALDFKNRLPAEVEKRLNYLVDYKGDEKIFSRTLLKIAKTNILEPNMECEGFKTR